jgi:hypothetical protein
MNVTVESECGFPSAVLRASLEMRTGIVVTVATADRDRLEAIVAARNSLKKHVWRARIVLATADGFGTMAIMQDTAMSKTAVWRWQGAVLRGRRRWPSARQDPALARHALWAGSGRWIVALTLAEPPGETKFWHATPSPIWWHPSPTCAAYSASTCCRPARWPAKVPFEKP